MKSGVFFIATFAASSSAQLNRVADRQLLRVRQRLRKVGAKSSKEPTHPPSSTHSTGAKASKPPHTHIAKTKSPTPMPSASPSKAGKTGVIDGVDDDDTHKVDIIASLSMEMDSFSFSIELNPGFGDWDNAEFIGTTEETASLSMSISMSIADVDPEFSDWDSVDGFEWTSESVSMSLA